MKVAIIGAGLSGLSCAHELERLGITAEVYEEKEKVGEVYPHVTALLQLMHRPIKDQLAYLKQNYFINLQPVKEIKKITMHGPTKDTTVEGNLGYVTLRGQDKNSLENQIASTLQKTKLNFYTCEDANQLAKNYDNVIVATGSKTVPHSMGLWKDVLTTYIKGAVVLGEFQPDSIEMWVNTDYAQQGYAYLIPFDDKRATLCLISTEGDQSTIDAYWHQFWQVNNFKYKIIQVFEIPYSTGYIFPHKKENICFVGNAGGFLEPMFGFGQFYGIISGVLAARCIAQNKDYETEIQPLVDYFMQMLQFRKTINTFTNDDYDKLIKFLGMPGFSKLIYNTNLDVIKYSSSALGAGSKMAMKKLFS